MNLDQKAKVLIAYLNSLPGFSVEKSRPVDYMGVIIVDAILQGGVNWDAVKERIDKVSSYPEARTTSGFIELMEKQQSVNAFLDWDGDKPKRILPFARYLKKQLIETKSDFNKWLKEPGNPSNLLSVNGIGPKTKDYIVKLAGISNTAMDVHWYKALRCAGIQYADYIEAKRIADRAAELWDKDKSALDSSVWRYFRRYKGDQCP